MGNFWEYLWAWSSVTQGLYHLNGNANDNSGNARNGTASNITWVNGKIWQCASFNGSSSVITNVYHINPNADFTCSMRVKPASIWSNMVIYRCSGNPQPYTMLRILSSGAVQLFMHSTWPISSEILSANQRYNLCFVSNWNTRNVYINWILSGTMTRTPSMQYNPTNQQFGNAEDSDKFNGLLDEVIMENRVRTPQEIQKYYTYSLGRFWIM